ncbi:MAG: hypothetical protein E7396_07620 [Ruminococcaceae bacterium]|nr:hypothetical protein [Oscillospiraceae bacterium]
MTDIIMEIDRLLSAKGSMVLAIEGRCASGKTTLANKLNEVFVSRIIHIDDFFLQPYQRTEERLSEPGGNFDRERLKSEVLIPLSKGEEFSYRPFVCNTMSFGEEIHITQTPLIIVEGSYSCHPDIYDYYDMSIFCDVDKGTQSERILQRNPDKVSDFINKWIPMEEKYFEFFDIKNKCDIVYGGK